MTMSGETLKYFKSTSRLVLLFLGLSMAASGAVVAYVLANPAAIVQSPELMEKTYPMTAEAGARAAHEHHARGVRRVPLLV